MLPEIILDVLVVVFVGVLVAMILAAPKAVAAAIPHFKKS